MLHGVMSTSSSTSNEGVQVMVSKKKVVVDAKYLMSLETINSILLSEKGLTSCKACGVVILPSMTLYAGFHMYCRFDKEKVS